MFAWWGRAVVRARWFVLAATLAVVAVGLVWGTGIFGALASGGFDDTASESSRANSMTSSVAMPGAFTPANADKPVPPPLPSTKVGDVTVESFQKSQFYS